jgi:hypothetical protein
MSAWIPNKEHINLLVKTADLLRDGLDVYVDDDLAPLGQMFVDEVVQSVSYRYPDDDVQAGELPGPCDPYYLEPYTYADPGFTPDAAEMRQIVKCYSYQACEHPGWEASTANGICEAILTKLGDGPSAGAWGWDERTVARRIEQGVPFTETVYG